MKNTFRRYFSGEKCPLCDGQIIFNDIHYISYCLSNRTNRVASHFTAHHTRKGYYNKTGLHVTYEVNLVNCYVGTYAISYRADNRMNIKNERFMTIVFSGAAIEIEELNTEEKIESLVESYKILR